jgi:hypothetical protein
MSRQLPTADEIRESVTDCNTWHRRFFRCFIDGSYIGRAHYLYNCEKVLDVYHNDRALRAFAIETFCDFIAHEEGCKPSTVRVHLVKVVDRDVLEALNVELIDDLRDLVRDQVEGAA